MATRRETLNSLLAAFEDSDVGVRLRTPDFPTGVDLQLSGFEVESMSTGGLEPRIWLNVEFPVQGDGSPATPPTNRVDDTDREDSPATSNHTTAQYDSRVGRYTNS